MYVICRIIKFAIGNNWINGLYIVDNNLIWLEGWFTRMNENQYEIWNLLTEISSWIGLTNSVHPSHDNHSRLSFCDICFLYNFLKVIRRYIPVKSRRLWRIVTSLFQIVISSYVWRCVLTRYTYPPNNILQYLEEQAL